MENTEQYLVNELHLKITEINSIISKLNKLSIECEININDISSFGDNIKLSILDCKTKKVLSWTV